MPTIQTSTAFGDLLDTEFREIFDNTLEELDDMIPTVFTMSEGGPRGDQFKMSSIGAFDDWSEFSGNVNYDTRFQGYDVTATHVEFASGMQVERKLFDDDQYDVMNQRPRGLAESAVRTKQSDGARLFNLGFSVDSKFYNHSEAVALFSDSHTTNSDASTATGFDNLGVAAASHTAVVAARIQMRGYRGDRAQRIRIVPNELWYPVDLYDVFDEIIKSDLRSSDAENAINVHKGAYTGRDWEYLDDTNNWFMTDSRARKANLFWSNRIMPEFAMAEDLDTLVAKWRGYMRYSFLYVDWRWAFGAQVS